MAGHVAVHRRDTRCALTRWRSLRQWREGARGLRARLLGSRRPERVATTSGITADDDSDRMVATVRHRFGPVNRPMGSSNGSRPMAALRRWCYPQLYSRQRLCAADDADQLSQSNGIAKSLVPTSSATTSARSPPSMPAPSSVTASLTPLQQGPSAQSLGLQIRTRVHQATCEDPSVNQGRQRHIRSATLSTLSAITNVAARHSTADCYATHDAASFGSTLALSPISFMHNMQRLANRVSLVVEGRKRFVW